MLVDALRHEPAAIFLVHSVRHALFDRQIEIAAGRVEHAVDHAVRNAVIGDIEEAGGYAGVPHLLRDRFQIAAGVQRSEIEDRHFIGAGSADRLMHGGLLGWLSRLYRWLR
jgi:hypothetical protein